MSLFSATMAHIKINIKKTPVKLHFLIWHINSLLNINMTYTYNIIRGVNDLLNDIDNDFFNYSWTYDRKRKSNVKKNEDGGYEAQVELPGYNKESLKIKVENKNLLTVRSAKEDEKDKVLYRLEISNDIDKNNIRAKSVDGILRIVLPQAEEAKVELIKIE